MQSIIVTGSAKKERVEHGMSLASELSSKFDTLIIDTQEEKGIDAIKTIVNATSRKPFESKVLSLVVLEAQNLTEQAQNALLKSLEEPTETTRFILTAPSKQSLLQTISSRLVEIEVKKMSDSSKKITDLSEMSLLKRLEKIEKISKEELFDLIEQKLRESAIEKRSNLKTVHRYSKLLIKLEKAGKVPVNKKLIELILALEFPSK